MCDVRLLCLYLLRRCFEVIDGQLRRWRHQFEGSNLELRKPYLVDRLVLKNMRHQLFDPFFIFDRRGRMPSVEAIELEIRQRFDTFIMDDKLADLDTADVTLTTLEQFVVLLSYFLKSNTSVNRRKT